MSDRLRQIQERVHGYWIGAPVPADEPTKHRIVRETCEIAQAAGLTEDELNDWARIVQREPSVAVVSAKALVDLQAQLQQPNGVQRFQRRLVWGRRR